MFEGIGRIAGPLIQNQQYRIVAFGNYSAAKRSVLLKRFMMPGVISSDSIAKKQERKPEQYSVEVSLPDHIAKIAN